jgi:hypothetical protein
MPKNLKIGLSSPQILKMASGTKRRSASLGPCLRLLSTTSQY